MNEWSGSDERCFLSLCVGVKAAAICLQRVSLPHFLIEAPLDLYVRELACISVLSFCEGSLTWTTQVTDILNKHIAIKGPSCLFCAESLQPIGPFLVHPLSVQWGWMSGVMSNTTETKSMWTSLKLGVVSLPSVGQVLMPCFLWVNNCWCIVIRDLFSRPFYVFECVFVCSSFCLVLSAYPVHYTVT